MTGFTQSPAGSGGADGWRGRAAVSGLCPALFFAFFLAGVLCGGAATAQRSQSPCARQELSHLVAEIQSRYQATDSFRANFAEQLVPYSGERKEHHGRIYFQKPGKMRWDFAPPDNQTIVSDGSTLYSYEPDLNQVVEVPISRAFSSSVATAFLLGVGRLTQDFEPAWPPSQPADGSVGVVLKPRPGQAASHTIELKVAPQTCAITGVRVEDPIGNVTTVEFLDAQINVGLDRSLFRFTVPAGADVIQAP